MLQFLVIAGPNGAGKSTFSVNFSRPGALIFDPDKEKYAIERQYPDISQEALESAVTRSYDHFELRALGSGLHLTVETNLRNDFLAERANYFRKAGYETRLIYMLLPDTIASAERVSMRVERKGHFVDPESIKLNFKVGLENLKTMFHHFDQLVITTANTNGLHEPQPQLLLTIDKGLIKQKSDHIPHWCSKIVHEIEQILTTRDFPKGRNKK